MEDNIPSYFVCSAFCDSNNRLYVFRGETMDRSSIHNESQRMTTCPEVK